MSERGRSGLGRALRERVGTIISLIVGAAVGIGASFLPDTGIGLGVAIGLVTAVLGLQIEKLFETSAITPKLQELERVIADDDLYDYVIDVRNAHEAAKRVGGGLERFFEDALKSSWREFDLRDFAEGRAFFSADRELTLNEELLDLAQSAIQAVSFGDDGFWDQPVGRKFLKASEAAIRTRSLSITRVFVFLDDDELKRNLGVMESQSALGIDCRILPPAQVLLADREDFVVYDQRWVRYAKVTHASTFQRPAILSVVSNELEVYKTRFRSILLRSVPLADYDSGHA